MFTKEDIKSDLALTSDKELLEVNEQYNREPMDYFEEMIQLAVLSEINKRNLLGALYGR